jgi:hypothetical protein
MRRAASRTPRRQLGGGRMSQRSAAERNSARENGPQNVQKPLERAKPSLTPARSSLLLRKCACGGTPGVDGECENCRRKRLALRRSPTGPGAGSAIPSVVHDVLRQPGQPMSPEVRLQRSAHSHRTASRRIRAGCPRAGVYCRQPRRIQRGAVRTQFASWGAPPGPRTGAHDPAGRDAPQRDRCAVWRTNNRNGP